MTLDASHWGSRLADLASRHGVPGAQLGILSLGADSAPDELVEVATGVLSTRTGFPATPDALFQIGSITKVWTATIIMMLVDEGRIGLDQPVAEILPGFALGDAEVARAVTVRHLLTHTSGIDGDIFVDTGRGDDCVERYVDGLRDAAQSQPLGATWSYANSGYVVLGRIVEVVTGTSWDAAVAARLTVPLGLTRTASLPEHVLLHASAIGHFERDGSAQPAPVWHTPRSVGPSGALSCAAGDVLAFARLHLTGGLAADGTRLLSAESAAAMADFQVEVPDTHTYGDSWGLGWVRYDWNGHRLLGHDGGTVGQGALLRLLPERGLAVTVLTNGGRVRDLADALFREVFGALADVEPPAPLVPPVAAVGADLTAHVGRYERGGFVIDVEPDGTLRQTASGPIAALLPSAVQEYALSPVGPGLFAVRPPGAETWTAVTFNSLPTGEDYVHFSARAARKVTP